MGNPFRSITRIFTGSPEKRVASAVANDIKSNRPATSPTLQQANEIADKRTAIGNRGQALLLRNSTGEALKGPTLKRASETFNPQGQAYQSLRNQMIQQSQRSTNRQLSDANDAIQRKFAAQGGSNSGAFLKFSQQTKNDINREGQDSLAANLAQMDQQQLEKFGAAQGAENMAEFNMEFQNKIKNFELGSKLKELDLADKQMRIDAVTTDFNKRLAAAEANKKNEGGIVSRILGSIL